MVVHAHIEDATRVVEVHVGYLQKSRLGQPLGELLQAAQGGSLEQKIVAVSVSEVKLPEKEMYITRIT